MKKDFKVRIFILALAIMIMHVNLFSAVYAYNNYNNVKMQEYTADELDDNVVIVNSRAGNEILTVKEDDKTRKVTIYNDTTKQEEYLILNKEDGSIYSSITGKTLSFEEQAPIIKPRSVTSYSTVYVSWAELKNTIGTTATIGGVIGLILTKVPAAQIAGNIISTISTLVGGGTLIIPKDTRHGLKFKVKTVKYYRARLGKKLVRRISKSIESVSRY